MAVQNLGFTTPLALRRNRDEEFQRILASGAAGGGPRIIPASGAGGGGGRGNGLGQGLSAIGDALSGFAEMRNRQKAAEDERVKAETIARAARAFSSGVKEETDPETGDVMVRGQAPGAGAALSILGANSTTAPLALKAHFDMAANQKAPPTSVEARVALMNAVDRDRKDTVGWDLAMNAPVGSSYFDDFFKMKYTSAQKETETKVYGNDRTGYYTFVNGKPVYHIAPLGAEPTTLERNLEAAGLKRGTQEYQSAVLKYLTKPHVDMGDNYGTIPPGFQVVRNDAGGVEMRPIPGSPAAQKAATEQAAGTDADNRRNVQTGIILDDIDKSIQMVEANPNLVTGIGGSIFSALPGSPAYDLGTTLESIKGNLAYDKLTAIKKEAGGVGAISDAEMGLLQNAYGALAQSGSDALLLSNLRRLKDVYQDIIYGEGKGPRRQDASGGATEVSAPAGGGGDIPVWNPDTQRIEFDDGTEASLDVKTGKWTRTKGLQDGLARP